MNKDGIVRLAVILVTFIIVYILVALRLFYWQIVRSDELKIIGQTQSTDQLILSGKRGEILSSDSYPLATNRTSYLLYANPKLMRNKKAAVEILSQILEVSSASVSSELEKNLFWVRIKSGLNEDKKSEIEKLGIKGFGFEEESKRFYPEASMAGHLIGFVGKNKEGKDIGYFGLEGFYNNLLEGRDGRLYIVKDALGTPVLTTVREEKKIDGRSLVLTVDRTIQYITERRLREGIERYKADGGSIAIMDPSTGGILAMAGSPSFQPANYFEYDEGTFKNPAISSLYEPGSTFKVLVMSAALDTDTVEPDTRCNICSGPITIGDYTIRTWNNKYHPFTTMTEVIVNSDNTGMVYVSQKLGLKNLLFYLKKFGLGETREIDLQGEIGASIRDEDSWYPIDLATAGFGQGIPVTPVQLLTAVSSIANDGRLMKPYVVSKIVTSGGKEIRIKPKEVRQVIKESTARAMTWMMVKAIEEGEAKWTKIEGYRIAGKTGTAQIPIAGHYDPERTIASFVGFFPADKPKISMLVILNNPKTSPYGSETAAPIFFKIARDLINYYNIPPSH